MRFFMTNQAWLPALLPVLLVVSACSTVPMEEQSEELRLLLGEIEAREQVLDKRRQLLEQRAQLLANLELRQETVAVGTEPLAELSAATDMKASFLPAPEASAGQCYRLARLAPRLSAEPQTVVVQDAADQMVVQSPSFRSEDIEIVVDYEPLSSDAELSAMRSRTLELELRPAYKSWQPIAATFDLRSEPLLETPAYQDFVPCGGEAVSEVGAELNLASHWCAAAKPAKYTQQQRRVVKTLSSIKPIVVPAEVVKVLVREPLEAVQRSQLRPVKRVLQKQTLTAPASYRREVLSPEFETVTIRQLTRPASLSWRQVLCEGKVSEGLLLRVQAALNERGYDAGNADGAWGQKTAEAVAQFRRDKMLPDLGSDLSVALLRQLEIELP